MKSRTYQDHIDPLVTKIQKCYAPGCGSSSTQVTFIPKGYIKTFDPIWVCSSGLCSDYDDIPSLRKPEDDPYAWLQQNTRELMNYIKPMLCDAHAPMGPNDAPTHDHWGQDGHLWWLANVSLKLCQPQA